MADAGRVMPLNKGQWVSGTTYEFLDLTYDDGSTYIAKNNISNSTVAPGSDTTNWQIFARGFAAELLSLITGTDTEGLLGTAGATVAGQVLIDEIANRVATKLIPYTHLVNNGTTTVTGQYALDGAYGKTLADNITAMSTHLSDIDGSLVNKGVYAGDVNNITFISNKLTVHRAASACTNIPVQEFGILKTLYVDGVSYAIQEFTSLSNRFWVRNKNNGVWSSWIEK